MKRRPFRQVPLGRFFFPHEQFSIYSEKLYHSSRIHHKEQCSGKSCGNTGQNSCNKICCFSYIFILIKESRAKVSGNDSSKLIEHLMMAKPVDTEDNAQYTDNNRSYTKRGIVYFLLSFVKGITILFFIFVKDFFFIHKSVSVQTFCSQNFL